MDPQGSTKGFVRVGDCPVMLDACRAACWQVCRVLATTWTLGRLEMRNVRAGARP